MTQEKKQQNQTDAYVGKMIRFRRNLLGLTQEQLGDRLGVTFQQIQKYEKGVNQVGASRLEDLARTLNVPVSYFFRDAHQPGAHAGGFAEDAAMSYSFDSPASPEELQLGHAFSRITDPRLRRQILELVKTIADGDPGVQT